jgi:hypothetical protein
MTNYIKVIDHPELVRDKESNAILNTDLKALNKYKQERDYQIKLKNLVKDNDQMKIDVNETKKEISEIKNLLLKVLEKR